MILTNVDPGLAATPSTALPQVRSNLRQSLTSPSRVRELLADPRLTSLLNVLVFFPYAIYIARGKKPPTWLVVASLGYLAINFFDDLRYLIKGEEIIESELSNYVPPAVPPYRIPAAATFNRYRVNR